MDLTNYFETKGGTGTLTCKVLVSTAKKAGCSAGTLHLVALGHRTPSWKLAQRLEKATDGQVTAVGLRPDVFGHAAPARKRAA